MINKEKGKLISTTKKGMKYKKHKENPTSFKKGSIPWNKGLKGSIPWNKGKKNIYSKDTKERISKTLKDKYNSKEIIHPLLGKKHTKKTKDKISKTKKTQFKENPEMAKRLSNAHKGKKLSIETRKKISENNKGRKHWNWLGGISFEPYDENWTKEFRRLIRKRDNQICMLCGIHREKLKRALHVHHIDYNKKSSIEENCISLCQSCHMKTSFNREIWIKLFQDLLSKRYEYAYSK